MNWYPDISDFFRMVSENSSNKNAKYYGLQQKQRVKDSCSNNAKMVLFQKGIFID